MKRFLIFTLVASSILALLAGVLHATISSLEIYTSNGRYSSGTGVDLFLDVTDAYGSVNFTPYNASSVDFSIAIIYLDDGLPLGTASLINNPGITFGEVFPEPAALTGPILSTFR